MGSRADGFVAGGAGLNEHVQDLADGALVAICLAQGQMLLDLIAIATAVLVLDDRPRSP
jgi:hypothetical protein